MKKIETVATPSSTSPVINNNDNIDVSTLKQTTIIQSLMMPPPPPININLEETTTQDFPVSQSICSSLDTIIKLPEIKKFTGILELAQLQISMGRSRVPQASINEDFSQRSKRKKASSTGENSDSTAAGQRTNEGKRALYHCNYCNKDITGKTRMKCATCPDFDLCVECFSVGAEVHPHKSNHPYRVMDNLSFPLFCPDWNADEEMLLLEGIEMYGLGNWAEVAEHVGTKSKAQCIDHYTITYINSPCFPLPDMSHVAGKNREELQAMAKEQGDGKKGFPALGELTLKEEHSSSSSRVKIEEAAVDQSPYMSTADPQVDRSVGEKKPKSSGDEGPSMAELSGYNPKRQEFDPEYDNDAEKALAEMEFKDTDTESERELKLRVLHIYWKRLDERKRRKDFILERNLLFPHPIEKDLSPEEKEIYDRYKVFMRFLTKEEFDDLIQTVINEHRIRKRIQELQEARDAGYRTSSEADRYLEQKRRREAEEAQMGKESSHQVGTSGKVLQKGVNRPKQEPVEISIPRGGPKGSPSSEAVGKDDPSIAAVSASSSSLDVWDIRGLPGTDLLSESDKRLCVELKLLPSHYLKMLEVMSIEIMKGSLAKKSDAHRLFPVDPSKLDRIYDMLVRKGIAPPEL